MTVKSAERNLPTPSLYIRPPLLVSVLHRREERGRAGRGQGRTKMPPWTRESNSMPSTGKRETSAEAVMSPVASIARETVHTCAAALEFAPT